MDEKRISFRRRGAPNVLELQFWTRFLAFVIDCLILNFFLFPLFLLGLNSLLQSFALECPLFNTTNGYSGFFTGNLIFLGSIYLIVYGLYSILLESSRMQATIGKVFFRYRVYDLGGNRISFLRAVLRYILKIISIVSIIGVWLIDITGKRQGLHDLIASTIVRRK